MFQGGRGWGLDAWAYWSVDQVHPYSQTVGSYGAFLYGPPLAQVFGVLGHLPWPVFLVGWTGLLIATYAWITQRYALVLLGLFPAAILELINGNIHLLLAAAIALGFRYPWTWSFVLLTKVTPGIGLVWFAVRREWRALLIAFGGDGRHRGGLVRVRALDVARVDRPAHRRVGQAAWRPRRSPSRSRSGCPSRCVVVIWGARTDRPWTVAVAAFLAIPAMWWYSSVMLLAIIPIRRMQRTVPAAPAAEASTTPDPTAVAPAPLTR